METPENELQQQNPAHGSGLKNTRLQSDGNCLSLLRKLVAQPSGSRLPPCVALLILGLILFGFFAAHHPLPATAIRPVLDEHHGVPVMDPYRWLENKDAEGVRNWVRKQNQHTRSVLNRLPVWGPIKKRVHDLSAAEPDSYEQIEYNAGTFYAVKDGSLITFQSYTEPQSARILLDPQNFPPYKNATIDFFSTSPDNRYIAFSLSQNGSENGTVHVLRTVNGQCLSDKLPDVSSSYGGDLTWKGDGSGFYYTRPRRLAVSAAVDSDAFQEVYFHALGTEMKSDPMVLGGDLPRNARTTLQTSPKGNYILASVSIGFGSDETMHFVLGPSGQWTKIAGFSDCITSVIFGDDREIYLLSLKQAPRGKVLRMPLERGTLAAAKTVVPESAGIIQTIVPTANRLYVHDLLEGSARLRSFDLKGRNAKIIPVKQMSTICGILPLEGDTVLIQTETFLQPAQWDRYEPQTGTVKTALSGSSEISFTDIEVIREFATSADGTKVPMHFLYRKGLKQNTDNPTILTGYGGYSRNETPTFNAIRRLWFDHGGVLAIAHLRGDGEYGEEWHNAGRLSRKQNVFNDFHACIDFLIQNHYTNPQRLAIEGASNGGLLVGAALTQYPQKFAAAVANVGLYDVVQDQQTAFGSLEVSELGSIKDPEQFKALYAYSPYHRVEESRVYPAVLLLTGANDNRVHPSQSWKMAARLQAAVAKKSPVLVWTSPASGHNLTAADWADAEVTRWAFLFWRLGVHK